MLKRILFIILILLLSQVCFAGRLQEMQKAVIAAKNGEEPEAPGIPEGVDRYVNTGSTAGGDGTTNATTGDHRAWASLSEALGKNYNLTAAGINDTNFIIYCNGSVADTTTSTLTTYGWTTDTTHRIHIVGDYWPKGGTLDYNTSQYRLEVTPGGDGTYGIRLSHDSTQWMEISYIQIKLINSNRADNVAIQSYNGLSTGGLRIESCLIIGAISGTGQSQGLQINGAITTSISNTVVKDLVNGTVFNPGIYIAGGTAHISNVTVNNCRRGITNGATAIVKNTIAMASTDGDFYGSYDASSTNNLSSDNTAPGPDASHYWRSQTASNIFVNTSTDLHLKAGGAALDNGTDLDTDATLPVTIDIERDTRNSTTPDIGADEQ
jgi:hypothetical protein